MKALIDGDVLVYKIGFACEKKCWKVINGRAYLKLEKGVSKQEALEYAKTTLKWDVTEDNVTPYYIVEPEQHAYYLVKKFIKSVCNKLEEQFVDYIEYEVFLTSDDKSNFRFKAAKTLPYKGNRQDFKKPELYDKIRTYLINQYKAHVVSGMEADDAMGLAQTDEDTIIVTIDKDLRQIPGHHYNPDTEELSFVEQPGELILIGDKKKYKLRGGGDMWFWAQMLLGDHVDNIQGIKGIGPKKCYDLLRGCKASIDCRAVVEKIYQNTFKDKWEERFDENSELLWIRRSE